MDRSSFPGQVLAVVFRRAPAFQPEPGEPTTFPGRIRAFLARRTDQRPAHEPGIHGLPPRTLTVRPISYSELRSIGEAYREGNPVLMDLSQLGAADAKRSVDFAAGLIFGTRGSISRVASRMFLLQPQGRFARAMQYRSSRDQPHLSDLGPNQSSTESTAQDAPADWIRSGWG
jgi:FtsZ-interacting cell division protein YlmF